MPITVCQVYTDFQGSANTWQGGFFRPKSFIYALHEAQLEILNEAIDEYEQSQKITDNLRHFIVSAQIPLKDLKRGKVIPYPKDYRLFSSLRYFSLKPNGKGCKCADLPVMNTDLECKPLTEEEKEDLKNSDELCENEITKVDNQRWGDVCQHELVPPSLENPYCTQNNNGFRVLPHNVGIVVLDYIAIPPRPTFIYTVDKKHNIICDPTKCVNLMWGEEMLPNIMPRLVQKYSKYTRNSEMYQQSKQEKDTAS